MKKLLFILFPFVVYSQGDCPPSIVCANTTGTCTDGSVDNEITATTGGCLGSEATRTSWLSLCFSTSGTLRFTIIPGGGIFNDMDFALWGPNSPCKPTTAPIRCSYAPVVVSKATGINSTFNFPQTDNSEGAPLGNGWVQDLNVNAGECYLLCISNYGSGNNNWSLNVGGTATLACTALYTNFEYFTGEKEEEYNKLDWKINYQTSVDLIVLERLNSDTNWVVINSEHQSLGIYTYYDYDFYNNTINYYRLSQMDNNNNRINNLVLSIDNRDKAAGHLLRIVDILGRQVSPETASLMSGVVLFYEYSDGTVKKIYK